MGSCGQRGFNLVKFAEHLRGDALCRRTLELLFWSEKAFEPLWVSIPEAVLTTDFLAFACLKEEDVYKHVPATMRADPVFIRALVNHTGLDSGRDARQRPWICTYLCQKGDQPVRI